MIHIDRNDIFKTLIVVLLSLLAFIGKGIHTQQTDISCRLRIVELNQARIMERMGVKPMTHSYESIRRLSKLPAS